MGAGTNGAMATDPAHEVWYSNVRSNHAIGNGYPIQTRWRGEDWPPPVASQPDATKAQLRTMRSLGRGFEVADEDLPEASYA